MSEILQREQARVLQELEEGEDYADPILIPEVVINRCIVNLQKSELEYDCSGILIGRKKACINIK